VHDQMLGTPKSYGLYLYLHIYIYIYSWLSMSIRIYNYINPISPRKLLLISTMLIKKLEFHVIIYIYLVNYNQPLGSVHVSTNPLAQVARHPLWEPRARSWWICSPPANIDLPGRRCGATCCPRRSSGPSPERVSPNSQYDGMFYWVLLGIWGCYQKKGV
jgi:hypothetical protein